MRHCSQRQRRALQRSLLCCRPRGFAPHFYPNPATESNSYPRPEISSFRVRPYFMLMGSDHLKEESYKSRSP